MPDYLPYTSASRARAYRDMLRAIPDSGTRVETKQGEGRWRSPGTACAFRWRTARR